jgi:hypothetical protein
MIPAPQQIPSGPHLGGIDISLRDHAAPEYDRDLMGIYFIVFCFATVNGFHIEGMSKDKGDSMLFAQISNLACRGEALA